MHPRLVPLREDLVASVFHNMRSSDRAEVAAVTAPGVSLDAVAAEAVRGSVAGCVLLEPDGTPAVAMGGGPCWPGCYSVWLIATDAWPRVWRDAVRWLARSIEPLAASCGAHRLQAHVAADNAPACRLMERLGFQAEGRLEAFGRNREPFVIYARVFG